jgi:hypothetical protein
MQRTVTLREGIIIPMMACRAAQNYKPGEAHDEAALLSGAVGAKPIFILENDV